MSDIDKTIRFEFVEKSQAHRNRICTGSCIMKLNGSGTEGAEAGSNVSAWIEND